ncbi:MAG: hypothetical protein CL681_28625 [Blastopirellula sp.]|nr:hypothetical protein [Blastopirellula sp.]
MSRRNDLLKQLLASDKFGEEKEQEQRFLQATAELMLTDLITIAINGFSVYGAGSLIINLQNDSTTYMSGYDIEKDIAVAERHEDEEVIDFLRGLMERIDANDWTQTVLITLISDAGTRTFSLEAGRSQESFSEAAAKSKE